MEVRSPNQEDVTASRSQKEESPAGAGNDQGGHTGKYE